MTFKSILPMMFAATLFTVGQISGQNVSKSNREGPKKGTARKEPTPQQQLKRIEIGFRAEFEKLQQAYRQAESNIQRQEIQGAYQELQRSKVAECLKLAAANRDTELAAETFSWILRIIVDDKARQIAMDQWLNDHVNDASLAPTLAIAGMANEQEFLRTVIKRATNKSVVGMACFNLAMSLRRSETLTKEGEREVITLLERVEKDFANVLFVAPEGPPARLGGLARPPLFEFKYLSVGKIAPEIEGEDIDGVKFKLSDYRGKVVLLSFWGDW